MNLLTTMLNSMIYNSHDDYRRLSIPASAMPKNGCLDSVPILRGGSSVVACEQPQAGVATAISRERLHDTNTGVGKEYVLSWPDRVDGGVRRISVLAPIGAALFGHRERDEVSLRSPGSMRRLLVIEVEPVTERSIGDPNVKALARLLDCVRCTETNAPTCLRN